MNCKEFANKAIEVSRLKTCYLAGGYGCRIGIDWYNKDYAWNKTNKKLIDEHANTTPITFGFDCVCLIKGLLWGFSGDTKYKNGGAIYESNGVPDSSIPALKTACGELSVDMDNIQLGEIMFLGDGHCGIYIGNGEVIESTPAWKCGVQRTLLPSRNTTNYDALPVRKWDCHGKLPYIDYTVDTNWEKLYNELYKVCRDLEAENTRLKEKLAKISQILAAV